MQSDHLDPRLRVLQHAEMKDKVVLVRVDHNVVKKGKIKDPYRIDVTFPTLYAIVEKGGRPILMTHVGRPRDKKTGRIKCDEAESITPIVHYLEQKLPIKIHVPQFPIDPEAGIINLENTDVHPAIEKLKKRDIGMIYLPNTRWFQGEQSKGSEREKFTKWLAGLADLYINDAFGSWQAHASTYDIASELPSYAGLLLQKEIANLSRLHQPERPFLAIIAGAKYDTKIGPLMALYEKADYLILGGILYNTFLSAKYGVEISGVSEEDKALALDLVRADSKKGKILELQYLVESEDRETREKGKCRTIEIADLEKGGKFGYILDADPHSLEQDKIENAVLSAKTIFVNAVMGLMPLFFEGSRVLYRLVGSNQSAMKLFGGGDTLQELRNLCPDVYLAGLDSPDTYYFTGGGSVLAAVEKGSAYGLEPIKALMED